MKERQKITPEKLIKVAHRLGGEWVFNEVMTANYVTSGDFILSNRQGLFIVVGYKYGETLPQWELAYKHPKHGKFQFVTSIGCSLDKRINTIASDLKLRLLTHSGLAYKKLADITQTCQEKDNETERDGYVIEALKKVMVLKPYYHHSRSLAFCIENEQGLELARISKWSSKQNFSIEAHDISPEKLIKIYNVLNE